jgi:arylsulfatase A-like enzyme
MAASAACARAPRHPAVPAGTPVVVVSIDTLRADRLPAYGYRGGATPRIDALAREGVLFENAYTTCPLTLPAHASLLTGRLPPEHGVRNNLGYALRPGAHPTLQGLLKARGYATGAAVSAYVLRGETGMREGFDFYDDVPATVATDSAGRVQRAGPETVARLRAFVDRSAGRPLFLFLHLYEPHLPYEPPEPFRGAARHPYDGEIAAADAAVGTFLDALRAAGLYDRALVVLTSDHGEGLGDHGEDDHGILLYREALHVPLIVRLPGEARAGRRVAEPVGLIDVLPTVAQLLGLPAPAGLPGRSLFAPEKGRRLYAETFYPRIHLGWSELRSVVDDRFHLIAGVREELFDLRADRAETRDVRAAEPAAADALRRELAAHGEGFAAPTAAAPEVAERLRALGYLAGPAPSAAAGGARRPDPRDQLPLLRDVRAAFTLAAANRDAEAVTAFRGVLARSPALFDAQFGLAESLARLGRNAEAEQAFARAQELWPAPSGEIAMARARVALSAGSLGEAERHGRAAAAAGIAGAQGLLARVALGRDDLAGAERAAREALARPGDESAALVLAEVHLRRNQAAQALALLDGVRNRQREAGGALRDLEFLRGDALGRLERLEEAQAAFEEEVRLFPDNAPAYARLAVVWALRGRTVGEVHTLLERMQAQVPGRETALLAARTLESLGDRRTAAAWRRRAGSS